MSPERLMMLVDLPAIQAEFAARHYLFTAHASDRAAQRGIFSGEIEEAVKVGEVIEDYPEGQAV